MRNPKLKRSEANDARDVGSTTKMAAKSANTPAANLSPYAIPQLQLTPQSPTPIAAEPRPNRLPSTPANAIAPTYALPTPSATARLSQQQQPQQQNYAAAYISARAAHQLSSNAFVAQAHAVEPSGIPAHAVPVPEVVFVVPTLSPRAERFPSGGLEATAASPSSVVSRRWDMAYDASMAFEPIENHHHQQQQHYQTTPSPGDAPERVYMRRTAAMATAEPLSMAELSEAQTATWPVPSRDYHHLTERLIGFYVVYDRRKANYKYVGRMLRQRFGEMHVGRRPNSFQEQELMNYLRTRYIDSSCCQKWWCAPACGGAYDSSALGWLQWWRNTMFLPGVVLLALGLALALWIQQYYITGDIIRQGSSSNNNNTFALVRRADSVVDGTTYRNWAVSPDEETRFPLVSSSGDISKHVMHFVPTLQVSSFIGHALSPTLGKDRVDIDLRIAFAVKDRDGMVVHTAAEITLSTANFVSATNCNHSTSSSCVNSDNKYSRVQDMLPNEKGLANWTKPKGGPAHGCIVSHGLCVPFEGGDGSDLTMTGTYRFPSNTFTTRAVAWPLHLQLEKLEYRAAVANVEEMYISAPEYIKVLYEAKVDSRVLSDFLNVIGVLLLAFGWCVGGLAFCVCCCGGDAGGSRRVDPFPSDREGTTERQRGRRRRVGYVSRDDDICTQLYIIWCCADSLPTLCMCTADCCDKGCESLGELCATTINACSAVTGRCCVFCDVCGSCANEAGKSAGDQGCLYYCMMCGDGAAGLCTDCNCDCGALDCAC